MYQNNYHFTSLSPSLFQVLLVCNAGLMTESSCEQLLELFSQFGPVTDVRMIPKKSFSFIAYANVESCVSAMEAVHGKLGLHSKQVWPATQFFWLIVKQNS